MFIFSINSIEIQRKANDFQELFGDAKYYTYFQYVIKCCPIRGNKYIEYSILVSKLRKKFHLTEEEVKIILTEFIGKKFIVVSFDDNVSIHLLANETRKQIMDLIELFPGVHFSYIKNKLSLGTRQTLWHLAFLHEFGLISEHEIGIFRIYGKKSIPYNNIVIGFLLLKKNIRDLLEILIISPNLITVKEIINTLGISRSKANNAIKKLINFNLLDYSLDGSRAYIIKHESKVLIQSTIKKYKEYLA